MEEAAEGAVSVASRPSSRALEGVEGEAVAPTSRLRRRMTSLGRFSGGVTPLRTSLTMTLGGWAPGHDSVAEVNNNNRGAEILSEASACSMTMMTTSSVGGSAAVLEAASEGVACSNR